MEIRNQKAALQKTVKETQSPAINDRGSGRINILPQQLQKQLTQLSNRFNLPVDLGQLSLEECTPEKIKQIKQITDLVVSNSKMLPTLVAQAKKLMNAEVKLAKAQAEMAKFALKSGNKMEAEAAGVFLAMCDSAAKSAQLKTKTNVRAGLIQKRAELNQKHWSESIFGNESELLDNEYQLKQQNRQLLNQSKTQKLNADFNRKQQLREYMAQAV